MRWISAIQSRIRQNILILFFVLMFNVTSLKFICAEDKLMSFDEIVRSLEKFDVSGQVVDKNNNPITNADVFLYYNCGVNGLRDRLAGRTKTDNEGKFKFEKAMVWEPKIETKMQHNYGKSKYAIIARHNDYGINFTVISQGDKTDDIKIILDKPNFTDITVTDDNGNKIENALVYIYAGFNDFSTLNLKSEIFSIHQDIGLSSGLTDKEGKIRLMCFPSNSTFWGIKEGYAQNLTHGENITLFPEAQISGRVTYEDGSPAEGMVVWYEYEGKNLSCDDVAITDKSGNYEFKNLPARGFRFSGMKKEEEDGTECEASIFIEDIRPDAPFVSRLEKLIINPGDKLKKDMKLTKAVIFSGKVINIDTNEPLPDLRMRYTLGRNFIYLKTNDKGEFSTIIAPGTEMNLECLPYRNGFYFFDEEWRQSGGYQFFRSIINEDMRDLAFTVKLRKTDKFTGRVIDESGKGVKDVNVFFSSNVDEVRTDESGKFEIRAVPNDKDFHLFAYTDDKKQAGLVNLKANTTEAEIKLEPTQTYQGVVLNDNGTPAKNFKFYGGFIDRKIYQTDNNGKITFSNFCPKAPCLFSWSSDNETNRDYGDDGVTIDLSQLKPGEPIKFSVKQYINAFMGKVVNEKKEPIEGAFIDIDMTFWNMRPMDARNVPIKSDKNGEFAINRLAYGNFEFTIRAKGYKNKKIKAFSDSIDYEVILESAGEGTTYRITVVDEEEKPIANAPVTLQMTLYGRMWKEREEIITAKTDAEGKAEIAYKLPQGLSHGFGNIFSDTEGYDLAFWRVSTKEDANVKLMLRKGGEYWNGCVLDQLTQKPIAGAKILILYFDQEFNKNLNSSASFFGQEKQIIFTTDANGKFELKRFNKKDNVSFHILASGYEKISVASFEIQKMGNVFRLLPGATIKGKLVFKGTGEPFKKKKEVALDQTSHEKGGGDWETCTTSEDGAFIVDTLKPGEYKISLYNFKPEDRRFICIIPPKVNAQIGKTVETVLEIEEGTPVKGKLIDSKTGKLPDVWISVFGCIKSIDDAFTGTRVNENGTWEIYLPEGTSRLGYGMTGIKEPKIVMPITVEKGKTYDNILIDISK